MTVALPPLGLMERCGGGRRPTEQPTPGPVGPPGPAGLATWPVGPAGGVGPAAGPAAGPTDGNAVWVWLLDPAVRSMAPLRLPRDPNEFTRIVDYILGQERKAYVVVKDRKRNSAVALAFSKHTKLMLVVEGRNGDLVDLHLDDHSINWNVLISRTNVQRKHSFAQTNAQQKKM